MHPEFAQEIDNVEVQHTITPFIQRNEDAEISKRLKANGGKPIESQRESIARFGKSTNPEATFQEIIQERVDEAQQAAVPDIFGTGI